MFHIKSKIRVLTQTSSAFGSTLTREQAFDDERWRSRLLNPQAKTFIARETDRSRRVLSSITLVGPESASEEQKHRLSLTGPVLQWELNGVFTLPEARRRGIAAAVMTAVKEHAIREASSKHSGCVLTVVVYTENSAAAKSWYEKMGFEALKGGEDKGRPTSELALLLARAE